MIGRIVFWVGPFVLAAQLWGAAWVWSNARAILDVDWDVVLSIVLGLAGIGYVVMDHRRTSKLDDHGVELAESIAGIKQAIAWDAPHTIAERIAAVESQPDHIEDIAAIRERLATIEARIDHKPITHTRGTKGRFVSPDIASTCSDEERRR